MQHSPTTYIVLCALSICLWQPEPSGHNSPHYRTHRTRSVPTSHTIRSIRTITTVPYCVKFSVNLLSSVRTPSMMHLLHLVPLATCLTNPPKQTTKVAAPGISRAPVRRKICVGGELSFGPACQMLICGCWTLRGCPPIT